MTRRESREQAFILIFEKIFNPELTAKQIVEASQISDDLLCPDAFSLELAEVCFAHMQQADEVIGSFAKGWKLSRLSRVCLSVLRLAVCEILYCEDIPVSATINEAVELAKKYATEEDASFINGILGAFVRSREA